MTSDHEIAGIEVLLGNAEQNHLRVVVDGDDQIVPFFLDGVGVSVGVEVVLLISTADGVKIGDNDLSTSQGEAELIASLSSGQAIPVTVSENVVVAPTAVDSVATVEAIEIVGLVAAEDNVVFRMYRFEKIDVGQAAIIFIEAGHPDVISGRFCEHCAIHVTEADTRDSALDHVFISVEDNSVAAECDLAAMTIEQGDRRTRMNVYREFVLIVLEEVVGWASGVELRLAHGNPPSFIPVTDPLTAQSDGQSRQDLKRRAA